MWILVQCLPIFYIFFQLLRKKDSTENKIKVSFLSMVQSILIPIYALLFCLDSTLEITKKAFLGDDLAQMKVCFRYLAVATLVMLCHIICLRLQVTKDRVTQYFNHAKEKIKEENQEVLTKEERNMHIKYSFLGLISAVSYYPFFMYAQNASELQFSETLPVFMLCYVFAFLGFGLFLLLSKDVLSSCFLSVILVVFLQNFVFLQSFLEKLFPMMYYWHLLYLSLVVSGFACYFFKFFVERSIKETILQLVGIVFTSLILVNGVTSFSSIFEKQPVSNTTGIEFSYEKKDGQPNVYYFLYDEYADVETLLELTGYDNESFYTKLQELGFDVSRTSVSGSSSYSTSVIATNYMNLGFAVNNDTPEAERNYLRTREDTEWVTLMKQSGYDVQGVGYSSYLGVPSITQTNDNSAVTMDGMGFTQLFFHQTAYYPFYEQEDMHYQDRLDILNAFDFFEDGANIVPNQSMFTVTYLVTPHVPFLFDEYGNHIHLYGSFFENYVEYYIAQYIYITNVITEQVERITSLDPNAIIILQSDHSARNLPNITFYQKNRILNAVYYGGESLDITVNRSGLNTIRLVLNELLGCEFELLEEEVHEP